MKIALESELLVEQLDDYARGVLDAETTLELENQLAQSEDLRHRLEFARGFVAVVDTDREPRFTGSFYMLAISTLALAACSIALSIAGPANWTMASVLVGFAAWLALLTMGGVGARQWRARRERLRSLIDLEAQVASKTSQNSLANQTAPPSNSP